MMFHRVTIFFIMIFSSVGVSQKPAPSEEPQLFEQPTLSTLQNTLLPGQVFYELKSGNASYRVEHPFKIFDASNTDITGHLTINPESPELGAQLELVLMVDSFKSRFWGVSKATRNYLRAEKFSSIQFHGKLDTEKWSLGQKNALSAWEADFVGDLEIAGTKREIRIPFRCEISALSAACQWRHPMKFSDYSILTPAVLWVAARDAVMTSGKLEFAPKRFDSNVTEP